MKITVVQSQVLKTKQDNISQMKQLLKPHLDTNMIVLPEMWITPYENEAFKNNYVIENSDEFNEFRMFATHQEAYVVLGSVPEKDGDKLYNTSYVFDPHGNVVAKYRKIHLFEITYPDGTTYKESDTLTQGENLVSFQTPFGKIGLMICFDIRFPRQSKLLQREGCDVIIVPGAFNNFTGPLHWKLAFRSRSVDNQLFTVGVSPSTDSIGAYNYYGHSIVVDPLGRVLFEANDEPIIKTMEIDFDEVTYTRKLLPIIANETSLKVIK